MIMFVGLETGLTGVLPDKTCAVFLSLGENFYFKAHEHEFYLAATAVVNFADN